MDEEGHRQASTTCTERPARSCKSPAPFAAIATSANSRPRVTQATSTALPRDAPARAWHDYLHLRDNPAGETRRALVSWRGLRVRGWSCERNSRDPCGLPAARLAREGGWRNCGVDGRGLIDR